MSDDLYSVNLLAERDEAYASVNRAQLEALNRAYAEGRKDQWADDKARIDELLAALRGLVDRDLSYFSGFVLDGCIPIKAVQAARKTIEKATKEQA